MSRLTKQPPMKPAPPVTKILSICGNYHNAPDIGTGMPPPRPGRTIRGHGNRNIRPVPYEGWKLGKAKQAETAILPHCKASSLHHRGHRGHREETTLEYLPQHLHAGLSQQCAARRDRARINAPAVSSDGGVVSKTERLRVLTFSTTEPSGSCSICLRVLCALGGCLPWKTGRYDYSFCSTTEGTEDTEMNPSGCVPE